MGQCCGRSRARAEKAAAPCRPAASVPRAGQAEPDSPVSESEESVALSFGLDLSPRPDAPAAPGAPARNGSLRSDLARAAQDPASPTAATRAVLAADVPRMLEELRRELEQERRQT